MKNLLLFSLLISLFFSCKEKEFYENTDFKLNNKIFCHYRKVNETTFDSFVIIFSEKEYTKKHYKIYDDFVGVFLTEKGRYDFGYPHLFLYRDSLSFSENDLILNRHHYKGVFESKTKMKTHDPFDFATFDFVYLKDETIRQENTETKN